MAVINDSPRWRKDIVEVSERRFELGLTGALCALCLLLFVSYWYVVLWLDEPRHAIRVGKGCREDPRHSRVVNKYLLT